MKQGNIKFFITTVIVVVFVIVCGFYGQSKGSYGSPEKYLTLKSDTVCRINNSLCMNNLSALVYVTNANSNKWVVLIHGLNMNGTDYAIERAPKFVEQGYNVLAPDLRGHGKTGGQTMLGYIESLDIYDWIKDLNKYWNDKDRYGVNVAPETIIVYGTSLGGGITLQLATNPDIESANGVEPYTKNLTDLKVKGFIDDCGYTSMLTEAIYLSQINLQESTSNTINNVYRGLIAESANAIFDVGIENGKTDIYEDAFSNGRKFPSGSKIMIIHDKQDTYVPFSNSSIVANNISPGILVHRWSPDGLGHAFYNDDFANLITKYIQCVEDSSCKSF